MAPPPASQPSWVILGTVARVPAVAEDGAGDLSLALAAPPRVSLLDVPLRVFPEAPTAHSFPAVLAADRTRLLLLHADQGRATGPTIVDRPDHYSLKWLDFVPGYFVIDACSATELRIPEPERVVNPGSLGLLRSPGGGGHYMVAELQPIIGRDKATLLCFSPHLGEWIEKEIHYSLPFWLWSGFYVVSHFGRLWWVDLSWGILTCDPFAEAPVLHFVLFPPGKVLEHGEAPDLHKYRCADVSAGKLRFVDMYGPRRGGATKVSAWTLADPDSTEWSLEHEASLAEIWADDSYSATGILKKVLILAAHPPQEPRRALLLPERASFLC